MLSQHGKTIQALPDELLVMIFSLLDEKSIFSCSLTCKQFALILQNYGHVILLDRLIFKDCWDLMYVFECV